MLKANTQSRTPDVTGPRITDVAERVVATMRAMGAFGRARARTQREVAAGAGCSTRDLQVATLNLAMRGIPVVTACDEPMGVFFAETYAEIDAYEKQLRSRIVGNALRLKMVRAIVRAWKENESIEPNGQRRLPL